MKNVILNNKLVRSVVLASSLVFSAFSANAGLILDFSENDIEVGLNDTFVVNLYATPDAFVDSILSWGLDINFDNGIIALNSFTLGADFDEFPLNPFIDADGIGGAAALFPVFAPQILLGTFEFTAVGYGSTSLFTSFDFDPFGFEGFTTLDSLGSQFNSAAANISVVSAPATVGLFSLAFLAIAGMRRRS
jgi:hypothetical protein